MLFIYLSMSMALQQEVAANSLENLQTGKLINENQVDAKAAFDAITDSNEFSLKDKLETGKCTYEDLKNNINGVIALWRNLETPETIINDIKLIISNKWKSYLQDIKDNNNISITFREPFGLKSDNKTLRIPTNFINQPKDNQSIIIFPQGDIDVFAEPKDIDIIRIENGDRVEAIGGAVGIVTIENGGRAVTIKDDYGNIILSAGSEVIVKKLDNTFNAKNIEKSLEETDAKKLFETGDGKMFEYIYDNWDNVSQKVVDTFKSKLQEAYPSYSGGPLGTDKYNGKKVFKTRDNHYYFFGT